MFGFIATAESCVKAGEDTALNPLGTCGGRDLLMDISRKQTGNVGEHPALNGVGFMGREKWAVGR